MEAGLVLSPSERIGVPRVMQSPVAFECRVHELLRIDGRSLVVADVVAMHVQDDLVADREHLYLDGPKMDLLARLHNPGWYSRPQPAFQMPQLSLAQWEALKQSGEADRYLEQSLI